MSECQLLSTLFQTLNFVQIMSPGGSSPYVHFMASGSNCNFTDEFATQNKGTIRLRNGCSSLRTIKHKLGHALGLDHEHQRADRDASLWVHWRNIEEDKKSQYKLINNFATSSFPDEKGPAVFSYGSFDFNSIMLYNSFNDSFAKDDSKPVLSKRYPRVTYTRGNTISQTDADAVEYLLSSQAASQFLDAPTTVADWQPWSSQEDDIVVTWNPVPNATKYIIYYPLYQGEFISYRTRDIVTNGNTYTFEWDTEDLDIFRVRVAAANNNGGFSPAFEADYDWK